MKMVIYRNNTDKKWYMTSKKNYNSYIQNAREIKVINGCETLADIYEFIENICKCTNSHPEDYEIIG